MKSRLSKETQMQICKLYKDGWPINQICKEVNCCKPTINNVLELCGYKCKHTFAIAYSIAEDYSDVHSGTLIETFNKELCKLNTEQNKYKIDIGFTH